MRAEARIHPALLLVTMCTGSFLILLDVTIVNVALPSIRSGLGLGVDRLQWIVDGYAIPLAALMLTCGTAGDRFGHRRIVLAGLATFGAASAACGLAPDGTWLVAARVAQGLGAAMLLPGMLAIIGRAFADRAEQARAIGIWAGIGSLALPAGPLLGGALIQWSGWRAVFLLNLPLVAVALPATAILVREEGGEAGRRLDPAGAVAAALFLAALTLAFVEAGRRGPTAPQAVVAALAAAALLGAFIAVERAVPAPMLPLPLLRRPAFTIANAAAATMNLGTLGMLFVLTLYLQAVQGRSSLAAGLATLPLSLPLALIAPLAGRLIGGAGPKPLMVGGLAVAGAGMGSLAFTATATPYPRLFPGLLAWGLGLALLTPAVVAAAMRAMPPARSGLASAVNNTGRQAGGAIGVAAFGAVAGNPSSPAFLSGMHIGAIAAAALYAGMAVLVLACLRPAEASGAG